MPGIGTGMPTPIHFELLAVADQLTQARLRVPAADAWQALHGRRPQLDEWLELRVSVLRLERAGLVESTTDLVIEVTDAGRAALQHRDPV
jgi:hypothetical protein